MRSVILGTAGHIDHGKTALVRELSGTDTDRLKEEKQRGITIELGFAHLVLGEVDFGIVDVPGHERFIKSMVAGAGGIDLVMLVVAADEGVMPQTREHLDICQLLDVQRGFVALSKSDLVDEDWRELVQDDLRATLEGTFLADAPIVPCSALTGAGLDDIRRTLEMLAKACTPRERTGLLRLPLDRVFTMKGFGTIVTGTLVSGTLSTGEQVSVLPSAVTATVRRVQVHGADQDRAWAGQRTAVNLGGVDRQEVARGEVLAHPGTFEPSAIIDAHLTLLPGTRKGLRARSRVLFHLGTRQQEASCALLSDASLEPGGDALVQLRFERPVVALPGDRFILRGFSKQENYGTTIGGGEVVRVGSRRIRPRDKAAIARVATMRHAEPRERLALEVEAAGIQGTSRGGLAGRLPLLPARIDALVAELTSRGELVRYDKERGMLIHQSPLAMLEARLLEIVDSFHRDQPLERGIGREELRSRLGRALDPRLYFAVLSRSEKRAELAVEKDLVRRSTHEVRASASLDSLAERLAALCDERGYGAPRDAEVAALLDTDSEAASVATKLLLDQKRLVRIATLLFSEAAIRRLEIELRAFLIAHETISAGQFKELIGQSRKFSIPLAEYFDAQRLTIRIGDLRRLRG